MGSTCAAVQLELTLDGLSARLHGHRHAVPTSLVEQSILLRTLAEDAEEEQVVSIPVEELALESWLKYNSSVSAGLDAHELLKVVQAGCPMFPYYVNADCLWMSLPHAMEATAKSQRCDARSPCQGCAWTRFEQQ